MTVKCEYGKILMMMTRTRSLLVKKLSVLQQRFNLIFLFIAFMQAFTFAFIGKHSIYSQRQQFC